MATFSKADISVTLTGEEWFAILARLHAAIRGHTELQSANSLSAKGAAAYNRGMEKLQKRLVEASEPATTS